MITPVIFAAPKQRYLVDRLVRYCKDLDGTEVQVVRDTEPENLGYPDVANWAFRRVCESVKGPFCWLEADSIPLKKGWLKKLEAEWTEGRILWSSDTNPPHDVCTGIGVYPTDMLMHLPESISGVGFDGWLHQNLGHLIDRTPLIEHSYGTYDAEGKCQLHLNPQPRSKSLIFHKDQYQTLIP